MSLVPLFALMKAGAVSISQSVTVQQTSSCPSKATSSSQNISCIVALARVTQLRELTLLAWTYWENDLPFIRHLSGLANLEVRYCGPHSLRHQEPNSFRRSSHMLARRFQVANILQHGNASVSVCCKPYCSIQLQLYSSLVAASGTMGKGNWSGCISSWLLLLSLGSTQSSNRELLRKIRDCFVVPCRSWI